VWLTMPPVFTMSSSTGCDYQGRPWLQSTREWLHAFGAEHASSAPLLAVLQVEVVHRHWGEVLKVATQALERIEEVALAVELGNRCVKRITGGVVGLRVRVVEARRSRCA
jgi:sugar phosphate isomerase/epimerase